MLNLGIRFLTVSFFLLGCKPDESKIRQTRCGAEVLVGCGLGYVLFSLFLEAPRMCGHSTLK